MKYRAKPLTKSQVDGGIDRLFAELSSADQNASIDELRKRKLITQIMNRDTQRTSLSPKNTSTMTKPFGAFRPALAVAAGLLFIGAGVWIVTPLDSEERLPANPAISQNDGGENARINGQGNAELVIVPSQEKKESPGDQIVGSQFEQGEYSRLSFSSCIHAAVRRDTQYSIDRTNPNRVSANLQKGSMWISKDPGSKDTILWVKTPLGMVKVTGTALTVDVSPNSTKVKVVEGVVEVTDLGGTVHTVRAGHRLSLSAQEASYEQLLHILKDLDQFATLGLRVHSPSSSPTESDLLGDPNTARERNNHSESVSKGQRAARWSVKEYLTQIETLRQQGNWTGMADRYQQLIKRHAKSKEASLAMVALGNLYLNKLGRPEKGLNWFQEYMTTGSTTLKPEALQGKAKCYAVLQNVAEETNVLKQMIQYFPNSLYAAQAKQRLTQLGAL